MRSHMPLMFPSTRKALWAHAALGGPVTLIFPRISLSVTEQVLFLAYGQSRSGKVEQCYLCGHLNIEPDCSEIVLFIDQLQSEKNDVNRSFSSELRIPTQLIRNSRHDSGIPLDSVVVEDAQMCLTDRARSSNKVDISEFLSLSAKCTAFGGTSQIHCDVDVNVALPGSSFDLTPIESISIALTALSKSVLGNDKHGVISSQQKSGYLTMDLYRKLVFLLESDPKVLTVPIIGIWVSGVDLITDPYIWANCVRYMHTTQIPDRVPKPTEPFLLVHKSPLMTSAQFFDCLPSSTALNFRLMSGSHGFSMPMDATGKRKGSLSVKLEVQGVSTLKGRQFVELMEQAAIKQEKENRLVHATPKSLKSVPLQNSMDVDSLPRSSPFPYKPKGFANTPSVPEVSLLDESNPLEAPKPERLALQKVNDSRLNCSPTANRHNPYMPYPAHREESSISRKITFDDVQPEFTKKTFNNKLDKGKPARSMAPPLRSPQSHNSLSRPKPPMCSSSSTLTTTEALHRCGTLTTTEALHRSFSQDSKSPSIARLTPFTKQSTTATNLQTRHRYHETLPHQNVSQPTNQRTKIDQWCNSTAVSHYQTESQLFDGGFQQPYVAIVPQSQSAPQGHTCQCQTQRAFQPASQSPTNPLSVITDTVQRLLSPRPPPASTQTTRSQLHFEQVSLSPIEMVEQQQVICTPPPRSAQLQQHYPISPEVQEILKHQDSQLKALQLQIQKLLLANEGRTLSQSQQSTETQTVNTKSATVNTGISLLESRDFKNEQFNSRATSDTHDSANDSSRSHSLIQHDLTTLDLPTQVTARSFTSDINVDYESFDDSPTGSPQREGSDHSRSDESWQSPVLGESVSMMAESLEQQESTKKQLDVIIRNVRDLLAKHAPANSQTKTSTEQDDDQPIRVVSPEPSSFTDHTVVNPPPHYKEPVKAKDVASATKAQLKRMGIEAGASAQPFSEGSAVALPRLQYISMMLTDSVVSDSNKSLELNALALKYLQDDQLTELAQLTVHRNSINHRNNESSLLRHVLTMPAAGGYYDRTEGGFETNMSMATQQYLKRYALVDISTSSEGISSDKDSRVMEVLDPTPANNLKSILRRGTEIPREQQQTNSNNTEDDATMSIQVLDIPRLKELPKLL